MCCHTHGKLVKSANHQCPFSPCHRLYSNRGRQLAFINLPPEPHESPEITGTVSLPCAIFSQPFFSCSWSLHDTESLPSSWHQGHFPLSPSATRPALCSPYLVPRGIRLDARTLASRPPSKIWANLSIHRCTKLIPSSSHPTFSVFPMTSVVYQVTPFRTPHPFNHAVLNILLVPS